uniref:Arabinogalactan endo-beta-1,4-galactanase n=1 Tax=uncultured bacterium contig00104 TaxID=1181571 RepID=A0A806KIC8_9BACT|nr:arabinogalactan endo-1,4-beta-galactosidase [uncultured bacterium contig00104]
MYIIKMVVKNFFLTIALASLCFAQNEPYALGADISWVQQRENERVRYYHNGQAMDMLDILKDNGFNYIRLRLFVDPRATDPAVQNDASGWNPYPYSAAGYCGLDSTVKYAKRVKDKGFKFLLDFHYSDTWADPGKQYKPMSWRSLNSAQLIEKVRAYTKESVQKFVDAGARPDMVQVGNEVVAGMIHPDGQNNSTGFARLVNAGINGVKDVDQDIKIMMHTISERNPNGWLTTLKNNLNGVEANSASKIDVLGLSYYPRWHGDLDSLGRILTAVSGTHNIKIAVVEYADFHREVNDLVWNLPSDKRFGTFAWEPEEFEGDNSKPLFDWRSGANSGRYSNDRLLLYPQMAKDYGLTGSSSSTPSSSSSAPSSSSATPSSSSEASSSSSEATPIISCPQSLVPSPKEIRYYNLKGKPLGTAKPSNPGVYIEKNGKNVKKIVVR